MTKLTIMLHLPANVVSKAADGEMAEVDILFSFDIDFTSRVRAITIEEP